MKLGVYVCGGNGAYTVEAIEKRPLQCLENGVMYDGDWIVGTDIRQGKGT